MKKSNNTTIYNTFASESILVFYANPNPVFRMKSDFLALCSQVTFLFQEKLPIIYANIRV